jgi:hypothetical protein
MSGQDQSYSADAAGDDICAAGPQNKAAVRSGSVLVLDSDRLIDLLPSGGASIPNCLVAGVALEFRDELFSGS